MSTVDTTNRAKLNSYQDTVITYITKENGHILVVSDDQAFCTQLRLTLAKEMGLTAQSIFTALSDPRMMLRELRDILARHPAPLIFIERTIGGRDLSFLVSQIKQAFTTLKIIVLTSDVQRDRLMLLHEVGADNFIAKPVSANTLIEKMAFTLKPQSKLGQIIDMAKKLLAMKKYDMALTACQKVLSLKPGSAAAFLVMGDVFRATQQYDKARLSYESAAKSADLYLAPLQRLAEMYEEIGDTPQQVRYLEKLDNLSPLNVNRKVSLGEAHFANGDLEKAEAFFEKAVVQMNREAADGLSALSSRIAGIYGERAPEMAEKFLRSSLEARGKRLGRSDLSLFNQLGISLRRQGRWQDAITEYKRAIKIAPDDPTLYYNVGMAFAEGADFLQAKANLVKAMDLDPEIHTSNASIACNFGAVFLQSGDRERASQFFQQALAIKPGMKIALQGLQRAQTKA